MKNKIVFLLSMLVFVSVFASCSKQNEEAAQDDQGANGIQELQDFQKSMEAFEDLSEVVAEMQGLADQSESISETEISE